MKNLHEQLTDAVENVLLAHDVGYVFVCTCGTRNNMAGDLLYNHRISLIDNAIEDVLKNYVWLAL